MKLSVCVPVYNGAKTISALVEKARAELAEYELEFVLVNDGSRDNSDEVCTALARAGDVKYICLRRNFGEHNAVMCALNYCTGDYAAIIDDDFQNPPAEIKKLADEAERGNFDVVYARYAKKMHNLFRNLGSKFNDIMATWLLNKPKDLYLCSFKLIKREVVREIIKYTGPFPYIDGLLLRVTNTISSVYVEHLSRPEGRSNYTLPKLVSLWLNMFINFSMKPLRVVTCFGLITAFICAVLGIWFFIDRLLHPDIIPDGWTSLAVIILFTGSVQMICLGLAGEYIGKNYLDKNGTPQWVVKKEIL